MIAILDNVLSPEECSNVIASYEKFPDAAWDWCGTQPMDIGVIPNGDLYVKKILDKILKHYQNVELDWAHIVKWDVGLNKGLHIDDASIETVLASVTYLNADYGGGGTFFEDGTVVKPCIGRTSVFDGRKYLHGVEPILGKNRYTIAIWYKRKEHESI